MDIHKPKPWHGVREFLKEYLIIVIGVLTALGAEAGVEWLHWRGKVADTEVALHEELMGIRFAAGERITVQHCLDRRIDQLEARVRDASGRLAPEPYWLALGQAFLVGQPYRTPIRNWGGRIWETANADETATHMPRDKMLAYANAYDGIAMIRAENAREFDRASILGVLQRGVTLTPQDKTGLLEVLEELRRDNELIALQAGQVLGGLKPLGVPPSPEKLDAKASATFRSCRDLGLFDGASETPSAN